MSCKCNQADVIIQMDSDMEEYSPQKAHPSDAGYDIFSAEDITLAPMERAAVSNGFCMQLPIGYEAQIRPRSGNALKLGLTVLNTPGTIDANYRGPVKTILVNLSNKEIKICKGMKIAQMVISRLPDVTVTLGTVDTFTDRGANGFGSTDKPVVTNSLKRAMALRLACSLIRQRRFNIDSRPGYSTYFTVSENSALENYYFLTPKECIENTDVIIPFGCLIIFPNRGIKDLKLTCLTSYLDIKPDKTEQLFGFILPNSYDNLLLEMEIAPNETKSLPLVGNSVYICRFTHDKENGSNTYLIHRFNNLANLDEESSPDAIMSFTSSNRTVYPRIIYNKKELERYEH